MICRIRPSTEADLPHILELNRAAIPAVNLLNRQELWNLFSQADYFHTLCLKQKLVGFLIALGPGAVYNSPNYRWFEGRYDQFLYVDRIVIEPNYQGFGYGRMFYDDLRQFAGQKFSTITCEVNLRPKNENSLRFHQRYGFRQVGVQETGGGTKQVSLMSYEMS